MRGGRWGLAVALVGAGTLTGWGTTARASDGAAMEGSPGALLSPVQGDETVRADYAGEVSVAVARALEAHGFEVAASREALGAAVVACKSPECVQQVLDAAGAEIAIVPALWARGDAVELTLTLVRREGRNLNARGRLDGEPSAIAMTLLDALVAQRSAPSRREAPAPAAPRRPNAWKAGPAILLAAGAGAFLAIGVGAATKGDDQQLNTGAVAAWSTVGALAIAGGTAWWVVGARRRRGATAAEDRPSPRLTLNPHGIDFRLRF